MFQIFFIILQHTIYYNIQPITASTNETKQ